METFHIPDVLPENCYHCQQALPGFRRDKLNQHFVSERTGNVVDRTEMERIALLADDTRRLKLDAAGPIKRRAIHVLGEFAETL